MGKTTFPPRLEGLENPSACKNTNQSLPLDKPPSTALPTIAAPPHACTHTRKRTNETKTKPSLSLPFVTGARATMARDFYFSIDRGGTFTDVFAQVPDGQGGSKFMCV